jgi:Tat protein translocase TatB subunit
MFGIGFPELLVILILGLIVLGPQRLPELARTLGQWFSMIKRAADDAQAQVRDELEGVERTAHRSETTPPPTRTNDD